jgi:hypothetical protein
VANLVVSAVSTYDNKGLKKASKEISSFEKNVKSLTKTFGIAFGASALINFGKKAINAFAADQAAAKSLEVQLKNTGYAFAAPDVEYYIANLQKMTGVLDDHLRPAFQTLLTASGSLTQSQSALQVALDTSAATGMSLEEVSSALAAGYRGQTKALRGLGVTLSKTALTAGHMSDALQEIGAAYSGQAAARLETYAGKMDKLKVATADATEIIGKGLLDALSMLGKDKSLDKFATDLNNTATAISYLVAGVTSAIGQLNKLFNLKVGNGSALDFFLRNAPVISAYYNAGKSATAAANAPSSNFTYSLGANANAELTKLQELKARKALVTQLKAEADLKKLQDKYNVERIGLMAALNAATDNETKQRLAEKLAILDGNAARAGEYLAARNADQALVELATSTDDAKKALDKLKDWDPLSGLKVTAQDIKNTMGGGSSSVGGGGGASSNQTPIYPPATTPYDPLSSLQVTAADIMSAGISYNPLSGMAPTRQDIYNVYNTVEGSILSQQELDVIFQNSLLQLKRNGASLNYAGF